MMGFGFLGMLLMLLFWGLLIAGAVWLIRSIFRGGSKPGARGGNQDLGAREILDQRYANGEITREQYQLMSEDLKD
ncbi:MAG: hypothetical protein GTO14_15890 [Anaerolineales bacterium]|nr:hypothetical protein [Anaerolineales bacterium]